MFCENACPASYLEQSLVLRPFTSPIRSTPRCRSLCCPNGKWVGRGHTLPDWAELGNCGGRGRAGGREFGRVSNLSSAGIMTLGTCHSWINKSDRVLCNNGLPFVKACLAFRSLRFILAGFRRGLFPFLANPIAPSLPGSCRGRNPDPSPTSDCRNAALTPY